jgi:ribosomal protein S13
MCGVISEAEKESIPVVEAMGYIYGIGDHLAREICDLRCEAMDDHNTKERFRDGLAQAAKFCGKTTDRCAVLHYGR